MSQCITCKFCNDNAKYSEYAQSYYPKILAKVYVCCKCRVKYVTTLGGRLISTQLFANVNDKAYVSIVINNNDSGSLYLIEHVKQGEPIGGIYFSYDSKLITEFEGFGGITPENIEKKIKTYILFS